MFVKNTHLPYYNLKNPLILKKIKKVILEYLENGERKTTNEVTEFDVILRSNQNGLQTTYYFGPNTLESFSACIEGRHCIFYLPTSKDDLAVLVHNQYDENCKKGKK